MTRFERRAIEVIIWTAVGVLLLLVLIALNVLPGLPPEKVTLPSVTYSKPPADSKFAVTLDAPIDHLSGAIDLPLIFLNWGEEPVVIQSVSVPQPCPYLQFSRQDPLPVVRAHSSAAYILHFNPQLCPAEAQPLAIFYAAKIGDVKTGATVEGYVSTPPLIVVGEFRRFLSRLLALLNSLVRLIIVPAGLAILAWLLSRAVNTRDERLKNEQEGRDRRNQVLNALIGGYRDLVVGDYLPISRRMQTVESQLPGALRNPAANPLNPPMTEGDIDGLLCSILLCRCRLVHFLTQKGGIYFRSKQAEMLMRDLLNGFFKKVWEVLQRDDFERAALMVDPDDTLTAARQKYASGVPGAKLTAKQIEQVAGVLDMAQATAVAQLATEYDQNFQMIRGANQDRYRRLQVRFLQWVNDNPVEFRAYTRLLQISTEVLAFECDRPFYQTAPVTSAQNRESVGSPLQTTGWYFDPPVLELTVEMYAIPDLLKAGIYQQLRIYLNHLPAECLRNPTDLPPNQTGDIPYPP